MFFCFFNNKYSIYSNRSAVIMQLSKLSDCVCVCVCMGACVSRLPANVKCFCNSFPRSSYLHSCSLTTIVCGFLLSVSGKSVFKTEVLLDESYIFFLEKVQISLSRTKWRDTFSISAIFWRILCFGGFAYKNSCILRILIVQDLFLSFLRKMFYEIKVAILQQKCNFMRIKSQFFGGFEKVYILLMETITVSVLKCYCCFLFIFKYLNPSAVITYPTKFSDNPCVRACVCTCARACDPLPQKSNISLIFSRR